MNLPAVIVLLSATLALQLYLTARQAQAFMRQVTQLRRTGRVAIGMGGRKWFGRKAYLVLAARDGRVVDAVALQGWTVFAKGKPRPQLVGRSVHDLAADDAVLPGPLIERLATRQAAQTLSTAGGWQPAGGVVKGKENAAPASSPAQ